jgi:uncharacterized protein YqeY
MPTLLDRIRQDRVAALRSHDARKAPFLSFVLSEAINIGKNAKPPRESTDEDTLSAIRSIIRRNEEAGKLITAGGGEDSLGVWQNEILAGYLPPQLDDAAVTEIINKIIAESGQEKSPKLMGVVMSTLKRDHNGQYNSQKASEIAKGILAG